MVENLSAIAGDVSLIPGSGRSPGEGNGNPLQYSCLGNPVGGGAWGAIVHGVAGVGHDWAHIQCAYLVLQLGFCAFRLAWSTSPFPHPLSLVTTNLISFHELVFKVLMTYSTVLVPGVEHKGLMIWYFCTFQMITLLTLVTICHHSNLSHHYCAPHTVLDCMVTYLFCNWKSVPFGLSYLCGLNLNEHWYVFNLVEILLFQIISSVEI